MEVGSEISVLEIFYVKRKITLELIAVDIGNKIFPGNNRTGNPEVFFSTLILAPAASVNSTSASVTSARPRMVSRSVSHDSRSRPTGPTSKPYRVNTIGPLIQVRSTKPATELYSKVKTASRARFS